MLHLTTARHPKPRHRPSVLVALAWYSPEIHRGIARYAREADWILDARMTHGGFTLKDWRGDGAITLLPWDDDACEHVRNSERPVVNIGDVEIPGIPVVRADNTAVARMAADHFRERGFCHYAFFRLSDHPVANRRMEAFRARVAEFGNDTLLFDGAGENISQRCEKDRIAWLKTKLADIPTPLAVFASGDDQACEVLHACLDLGISVPEQVAVLGVDNDRLRCELAPVPLSSVDNNLELVGYRSAALLDRLFKGKVLPNEVELVQPIAVATRQSTDILAIGDPHVASALRHIRLRFADPINAKTVAATIPVSYPTLHNAFKKSIGRTIADEITYRRLEKARSLLVNTHLSVRDIATQSGFPDEDRMGKIFRRETGRPPSEYRRQNQKIGF